MTCVYLCPESPRWLVQHGRIEEAKAILCEYHSDDGKSNAVIELQLREFEQQIEFKRREPWWDYRCLFRTRNARWRMLCLILMCVNGQLAGNGVRIRVSGYAC